MNLVLIMKILKRQKPYSIIDPFMGSGTIAFCCKQLGIKYLGYEIEQIYKIDIDKRLKQKQIDLRYF